MNTRALTTVSVIAGLIDSGRGLFQSRRESCARSDHTEQLSAGDHRANADRARR
jgi:hypothetical protein